MTLSGHSKENPAQGTGNPMHPLSLYLHIPFCRHRCAYCDFNTYTQLDDLKTPYTHALCQEIRQVAGNQQRPVHTIFFGGGTPSLMPLTDIQQILETIADCFQLLPDAEITMEANPDTVTAPYLAGIRALGVNRLSFGVQSTHPTELTFLERTHDFQTVIDVVTLARQAGFDNFNLDLIYGLPHQTLQTWQQSLDTILTLNPSHLSLYCLTIEEGTPLHRWVNSGTVPLPDPDLAADQYQLACERLATADFTHYEISNWAKDGQECRHNLTYWRNQDYLGLGAGAHGHANNIRYHVVKHPRTYIQRLQNGTAHYPYSSAVAEHTPLSHSEQINDTIITQLRLLQEGLNLTTFAQTFGQTLPQLYPDTLPQLLEWQLLHIQNDTLRLTHKGKFLSNQVFYRLLQ